MNWVIFTVDKNKGPTGGEVKEWGAAMGRQMYSSTSQGTGKPRDTTGNITNSKVGKEKRYKKNCLKKMCFLRDSDDDRRNQDQ